MFKSIMAYVRRKHTLNGKEARYVFSQSHNLFEDVSSMKGLVTITKLSMLCRIFCLTMLHYSIMS